MNTWSGTPCIRNSFFPSFFHAPLNKQIKKNALFKIRFTRARVCVRVLAAASIITFARFMWCFRNQPQYPGSTAREMRFLREQYSTRASRSVYVYGRTNILHRERRRELALGDFQDPHFGFFPFGDTSRHKYRSVFVIYWMPRKIERCLCRLLSLNGKHLSS